MQLADQLPNGAGKGKRDMGISLAGTAAFAADGSELGIFDQKEAGGEKRPRTRAVRPPGDNPACGRGIFFLIRPSAPQPVPHRWSAAILVNETLLLLSDPKYLN